MTTSSLSTAPDSVATPTLEATPAPTAVSTALATGPRRADATAALALVAPLLLFAHGILDWVDGLGLPADPADRATTGTTSLGIAAGAVLVAAIGLFCWLTTSLAARLRHVPLAIPAGVLAAFGAGAAGTVWLGR